MARTWTPLSKDQNESLLKMAMNAPMLEKDHELDLARRWRDNQDQAALNELTKSYLRLVIAHAGRVKNYGLPLTDLIQEGCIGLMEAAARFEPERGIRFSTYANWWIKSSMQDYILRNWSIVRTGTTAAHKSLFFNLRRLRAKFKDELDGPLSLKAKLKIAKELDVKVKDIELMEGRLSASDHSLNMSMGEQNDTEWQDALVSEGESPEEIVMKKRDGKIRSEVLSHAMTCLTERENIIIRERRLTTNSVTLADLGERLGISKERVRQLEIQAMNKMRDAISLEERNRNLML